MKKSVFWCPLLLVAVCLWSLGTVWAAELEGEAAAPEREFTLWEMSCLALPNGRVDRLNRYAEWAVQNPEMALETVVMQVNLDLDRPVYEEAEMVTNPECLTILVNKHYALPADYVPELEVLGAFYGSGSLRPEAAQAFRAMADGARAEGISLRSVSAYRSYSHQANTYNRYLKYNRQAVVDTFSARPGYSEHQTGLALDINVANVAAHFERTPAYAWLQEHCAEYGFILRYMEGKENITGYRFEPWHYRYVGVEIAQACMEQGLTYEEYLALQPELKAVPEAVPEPEPAFVPEETPAHVRFPFFKGTPIQA